MITTEQPTAGTAHLKWTSDFGFRLDFTGVSEEMTVAISGIPVPADGTIELQSGPLELDKLDLLFKAQVDVGGLPGQVHEAQIVFTEKRAELSCVVEEVESGELIDFECGVEITIPDGVPETGGPKPIPSDDEELDWEDDDTLEAMLGDDGSILEGGAFPLPSLANEDAVTLEAPKSEPTKGKGLDALLKALLGSTPEAEAELEAEAGFPDFEDEEQPVDSEPAPVEASVFDPANAKGLLELLVKGEDLELEDGFSVDDLVGGAAPIIAAMRPSTQKATALTEWLFQQDAVAELYMDDDSLASLLEQW
jgi:hypothetical protein